MRDYRIILEPIEVGGPDDYDLMRARVEADLHDAEFRGFELRVADLQQMPRMDDSHLPTGEGLIPTMGIEHPWDAGMDIFPRGHPLYEVEQAVKGKHKREVQEELVRVRRKELNP